MAETEPLTDEAQQEEDKTRRVRDIFLSAAGTHYSAFASEQDKENAIAWFGDNFEWREVYEGDEAKAANDMVAAYAGIESSDVNSEAKRAAQANQSQRKCKRPRGSSGANSSGAGSSGVGSSGAGSSSQVPLAGPASDAVSALVTFLRAFAAMSAEEQRALFEKLQRQ